ncbi:MAG: tetratricopeptide repeat protein [Planctomyces sp.]
MSAKRIRTHSTQPSESPTAEVTVPTNPLTALLKHALLLLITGFAYLPAITAGYIWDDPAYVTENPELKTFSGLKRIWLTPGATPQYYPMVFTTFWVEYQLWGLSAPGYHINNLFLHAGNSILLYLLLARFRFPGALSAAAIFAVHPVHVESVAWITERKNVLSGFFFLLAFHSFWSFLESGTNTPETRRKRRRFYVAACLLFVAALLSKSVTASLPAAILVVIWWQFGRITWNQVLSVTPLMLLGIFAGLHTAQLEAEHVGAEGAEWNWSVWERCLIAGRALWFYAAKLVWPHPLIFIYHKWKIDPASLAQAVFPVTAVLLPLVLLAGKSRWGRGPLAAVLLFGGTLVPALGFADVYPMRFSFVADHFQYLGSIGMIVLLSGVLLKIGSWLKASRKSIIITVSVLVLLFGGRTFVRCFDYKDRETLWTITLRDHPECWLASLHLAEVRMEQDRYLEALEFLEQTVANKPPESFEPSEMSDLYLQMATCCRKLNDTENAERHTRKSLECLRLAIGDKFQDQSVIHFNLGALHRNLGELPESAAELRRALEVEPENANTHLELGSVLLQQQLYRECLPHFEKAMKGHSRNPHLHFQMGMACHKLHQPDLAFTHLQTALKLKPDFEFARALMNEVTAELEK